MAVIVLNVQKALSIRSFEGWKNLNSITKEEKKWNLPAERF